MPGTGRALIKVEDDFSRNFPIANIPHREGARRALDLDGRGDRRDVAHEYQGLARRGRAATSFAVEGVAGALARKVAAGFESYRDRPGVDMNPKTYKWIREHSQYDDEHPKFALEIVKHYAVTERMQRQVMVAARRSLELLNLALLTASQLVPQGDAEPQEPAAA